MTTLMLVPVANTSMRWSSTRLPWLAALLGAMATPQCAVRIINQWLRNAV